MFEFIVLIDDDEATNVYHEIIIEESGLVKEFKFFDSPIQALSALKEHNKSPDLIFLDINMPKMDGWEFLDAYSSSNVGNDATHIVMLTTSLSPQDQRRAEEQPLVKKLVNKPLTKELLQEMLQTISVH